MVFVLVFVFVVVLVVGRASEEVERGGGGERSADEQTTGEESRCERRFDRDCSIRLIIMYLR